MGIIEYLCIAFAVSGIGMSIFIVVKAKKNGTSIPWDLIQPILFDTFFRIQKLSHLKNADYVTLENYTVKLIQEAIDKGGFLKPAERALVTDDVIRSIISVRLKRIYQDNQEK